MRNIPLRAFAKDSPVKHKMKVKKGGHGSGGIGFVGGVTAEDVSKHDSTYGEGHKKHSAITPMAGHAVKKKKATKKKAIMRTGRKR